MKLQPTDRMIDLVDVCGVPVTPWVRNPRGETYSRQFSIGPTEVTVVSTSPRIDHRSVIWMDIANMEKFQEVMKRQRMW